MRKTNHLLKAIVDAKLSVVYYAVDLSEKSLKDSLEPLTKAFPTIKFVGLWGTYEDSLLWVYSKIEYKIPKLYLWLGSSIGNLTRAEAAEFMLNVQKTAMNPLDTFLCGIDRRNQPERIALAYNDRLGVTRDFILNGLDHINSIFGEPVIDRVRFEYVSVYNAKGGRHEAYYKSIGKQSLFSSFKASPIVLEDGELLHVHSTPVALEDGEMINVEYSYKYSQKEVDDMVDVSGLKVVTKWTDSSGLYDLHLLRKE